MATKLYISSSFTILSFTIFSLTILFSFSSAANVTNSSDPCNSTPYPTLCKSSLPYNHVTANVYDYGRYSVRRSYSAARSFLSLIENYLRSSSLTTGAIRALQDCHLLAGLNMDYLSTSFPIVNKTQTLSPSQEDDVHTLLSSIITNTQTCLDSIQETASSWSSKNGVSTPLSDDSKLYSVSLALFKKGWVHKKNKGPFSTIKKQSSAFRKGKLPLKMSNKNKAIFDKAGRRKLLQTSNDGMDYVQVSDIVVVSQDGTGNFTTINGALAAAPNYTVASDGYFMIYVTAGVYQEYVSIPSYNKYVLMIGDGINQTVITGNHSVGDGWTTFNSATFAVVGSGFVGVNMTIRNTAGAIKNQAVALRNGADLSAFYSCSFEGYQDTLYTHSNRQYYTQCDIYGTVDFIFGNAAVVFQDCNIYPRLALSYQFNTITAQGRTDPNQNTGTSIQNCNVRAASDLASSNITLQTYLGRPWKLYSRTIVMQTYMDSLINPAGWALWSGDFALSTLYYAEFNNTGPGSNTSARVTWPGYSVINVTSATNFTVANFISGDVWLPVTGVPYNDGL